LQAFYFAGANLHRTTSSIELRMFGRRHFSTRR
jgi:hypothetical protein